MVFKFVWNLMRMVKGGSRLSGKGGGIEMTVHVMVPSTGLWPVDATPFTILMKH